MLGAAPLSDAKGRVGVLRAGLLAAAVLGLVVPFAPTFPVLVALRALQGLALGVFTFGFFTAHAVASAGVGARGGAEKAAASAHYLLAYYTGSSAVGTLGGVVYAREGWPGVVALAVAVALALRKGARAAPAPARDSG